MKKFFFFAFQFFLIICSLSSFENNEDKGESKKYLIFPFKRNLSLSESATYKEFFKTMFYNQIYINMTVGSQKQNIPFYLYLLKYPLVLQPSNIITKGEVKGIYNHKNSQSYKELEGEKEFRYGDLQKGILSEDIFYFNSTSSNINFYLSIENYAASHITEGGILGFKYRDQYDGSKESEDSNFIMKLKKLDIISSYDFSILYDSTDINEDSGKVYIGSLPHEINNKTYDELDFKTAYSSFNGQWEHYFQKISLGNKTIHMNKEAYFVPEFGFIIGSYHLFDELNRTVNWYEIFNSTKCHSYEFQIDDFGSNDYIPLFLYFHTGYYCEKDVNVNDFFNQNTTNITFTANNFEYEFILNNKELWVEHNGYKYFLILKAHSADNFWIFGKPFFKKFHMNFNLDSRKMGVYTKVNLDYKEPPQEENKKDNTVLYICIISVLVVLVGVLLFVLIRIYVYKPRKKRANELLDDNYEYREQNKEGEGENKIVPSENNIN